jgi:hypothetical protein
MDDFKDEVRGELLCMKFVLNMLLQAQPELRESLKLMHIHQTLLTLLLSQGVPQAAALAAQRSLGPLLQPAAPNP